MRKSIIITMLAVFFFMLQQGRAQSSTQQGLRSVLTADSLASGNMKDILISFFQLSFNNLTGENKELSFNSNPFALMLKNNPSLAIDTSYRKYKHIRKLNFGFSLRLDTSYKFSGFSFGIKYAIINKRDSTTSKWLFKALGSDTLNKEFDVLTMALFDYIEKNNPGDAFTDQVNILTNDNTIAYNALSPQLIQVADSIMNARKLVRMQQLLAADSTVNFKKQGDANFTVLKQELKTKPLWTVNFSDTTYKDQFVFSNLVLATQFLKGMGKFRSGSNLELDLKSSLNFMDDTSYTKRDLKRCLFNAEAGVNWVIRNKANDRSWFEMKFSGAYQHNFNRLYSMEQRDLLTFNGTVRVRLIADIWLPLEFKYDPKSGNVFGFLNVRANFNTLGNIAKGK